MPIRAGLRVEIAPDTLLAEPREGISKTKREHFPKQLSDGGSPNPWGSQGDLGSGAWLGKGFRHLQVQRGAEWGCGKAPKEAPWEVFHSDSQPEGQ